MTARTHFRPAVSAQARSLLMLPLGLLIMLSLAAGTFVTYVLWPTWSNTPVPLAAPEVPITVAGVLFNVPSAAIRAAVQRQPGPHERVDLAFLWPSLMPPQADAKPAEQPAVPLANDATGAAPAAANERLFVTIAGLGAVLPPVERLRSIYPHYLEAQATAGPDGLAILSFRVGTPYQGEDLVYLAAHPEQFFARCTRHIGVVPGTCIHERAIDAAVITLRFPREWLDDWRSASARFDRLVAQLHPG